MRLRSLNAVAAAGSAVIMLGGCGGGGGGQAAPAVVIPTQVASVSARPAAPTPTVDVTSETYESAKSFVGHYVDLVNYAYRTGDARPMRSQSLAECVACSRYSTSVSDVFSSGGHFEKYAMEVTDLAAPGRAGTEVQTVMVTLDYDGLVWVDNAGKRRSVDKPASDVRLFFRLQHAGDGWRVAGIDSGAVT
ncbi:DUF6318 family protein [Motilibacter deserti]|uniref:DUF6318 domain-containing protein n=1 Tax=Motilibacter deserti TaxID=2714956 RepID=A0ABX0GS12_9ACTN|nr:DUF6318 family protein [Motilibacter deserti]NHC13654.1 hypothetical protein [Motilibacter deserti]